MAAGPARRYRRTKLLELRAPREIPVLFCTRDSHWPDVVPNAVRSPGAVECVPLAARDGGKVENAWPERFGVGADGAVLVRPDGFVAWRSRGWPSAPEATLQGVLREIRIATRH